MPTAGAQDHHIVVKRFENCSRWANQSEVVHDGLGGHREASNASLVGRLYHPHKAEGAQHAALLHTPPRGDGARCPFFADEPGEEIAIGKAKTCQKLESCWSLHSREHGCSIRCVEGVGAAEVESDLLSEVSLDDPVCAPAAHSRRPASRNAGQQPGNLTRVAAGYAGQRLRHRSLTGVAGSGAHTAHDDNDVRHTQPGSNTNTVRTWVGRQALARGGGGRDTGISAVQQSTPAPLEEDSSASILLTTQPHEVQARVERTQRAAPRCEFLDVRVRQLIVPLDATAST